MKNSRTTIRPRILLLLLLIAILGQGCLVFRYSTTPKVSGIVIDEFSKQPVIGAKVGMRDHGRVFSLTENDGSFSIPSDYQWGPAFIIPMEGITDGKLFVEAPDYLPSERIIESWCGTLVELEEPIELERE